MFGGLFGGAGWRHFTMNTHSSWFNGRSVTVGEAIWMTSSTNMAWMPKCRGIGSPWMASSRLLWLEKKQLWADTKFPFVTVEIGWRSRWHLMVREELEVPKLRRLLVLQAISHQSSGWSWWDQHQEDTRQSKLITEEVESIDAGSCWDILPWNLWSCVEGMAFILEATAAMVRNTCSTWFTMWLQVDHRSVDKKMPWSSGLIEGNIYQ